MFLRIREKGWKAMIWTAAFVSPDCREYKMLRHGKGYMIDGKDVLAYDKARPGLREVGRVEPVAAVVREPAAVHDVDAAREAAPRKRLGVGVDARLPHTLDRDLDPVVPLGLREEKLGRRASVEREMLRARGEVRLAQRRPRHDRLDLLHV